MIDATDESNLYRSTLTDAQTTLTDLYNVVQIRNLNAWGIVLILELWTQDQIKKERKKKKIWEEKQKQAKRTKEDVC